MLLHFITGYQGLLQAVTSYHRLLQVIKHYYGLLGIITVYYRLLQVITGDYRFLRVIRDYYRLLQVFTGYDRLLQVPLVEPLKVLKCFPIKRISKQNSFWELRTLNYPQRTCSTKKTKKKIPLTTNTPKRNTPQKQISSKPTQPLAPPQLQIPNNYMHPEPPIHLKRNTPETQLQIAPPKQKTLIHRYPSQPIPSTTTKITSK